MIGARGCVWSPNDITKKPPSSDFACSVLLPCTRMRSDRSPRTSRVLHLRCSPRGTEDTTLRRMRTPSMSLHASELESVGHRTGSTSSRGGLLRLDTERAKRIVSREKDAIHAW